MSDYQKCTDYQNQCFWHHISNSQSTTVPPFMYVECSLVYYGNRLLICSYRCSTRYVVSDFDKIFVSLLPFQSIIACYWICSKLAGGKNQKRMMRKCFGLPIVSDYKMSDYKESTVIYENVRKCNSSNKQ